MGTPLAEVLAQLRVDEVVICGFASEACVDTTVRSAFAKGFEVVLAAGAHTTNANPVLSAEQIIQHHELVRKRLARVVPAGEVGFEHGYAGAFVELGVLRRSTPAYRDINYEDDSNGWKLDWAGRALGGYSWELGRHFWIAAAVGLSVGHETGDHFDYDDVTRDLISHKQFDHALTASEGMFRIGSSF